MPTTKKRLAENTSSKHENNKKFFQKFANTIYQFPKIYSPKKQQVASKSKIIKA